MDRPAQAKVPADPHHRTGPAQRHSGGATQTRKWSQAKAKHEPDTEEDHLSRRTNSSPCPYRVSKKAGIASQRSDPSSASSMCFVLVDSSISAFLNPARLRPLHDQHPGPCHTRISRGHGRTRNGPTERTDKQGLRQRPPHLSVRSFPRPEGASRTSTPGEAENRTRSAHRSRYERESHLIPISIGLCLRLFRLQIRYLSVPLRSLLGQPLFGIAQLLHHGQDALLFR